MNKFIIFLGLLLSGSAYGQDVAAYYEYCDFDFYSAIDLKEDSTFKFEYLQGEYTFKASGIWRVKKDTVRLNYDLADQKEFKIGKVKGDSTSAMVELKFLLNGKKPKKNFKFHIFTREGKKLNRVSPSGKLSLSRKDLQHVRIVYDKGFESEVVDLSNISGDYAEIDVPVFRPYEQLVRNKMVVIISGMIKVVKTEPSNFFDNIKLEYTPMEKRSGDCDYFVGPPVPGY